MKQILNYDPDFNANVNIIEADEIINIVKGQARTLGHDIFYLESLTVYTDLTNRDGSILRKDVDYIVSFQDTIATEQSNRQCFRQIVFLNNYATVYADYHAYGDIVTAETVNEFTQKSEEAINTANEVTERFNSHEADNAAHGATPELSANTIALRDENKTFKVGIPQVDENPARKKELNEEITARTQGDNQLEQMVNAAVEELEQSISDAVEQTEQKIAAAQASDVIGIFHYGKTLTSTVFPETDVNVGDRGFSFYDNKAYIYNGTSWAEDNRQPEIQDGSEIIILTMLDGEDITGAVMEGQKIDGLYKEPSWQFAVDKIGGGFDTFVLDNDTIHYRSTDNAVEINAHNFDITEDITKFTSGANLTFKNFWKQVLNKINGLITKVTDLKTNIDSTSTDQDIPSALSVKKAIQEAIQNSWEASY